MSESNPEIKLHTFPCATPQGSSHPTEGTQKTLPSVEIRLDAEWLAQGEDTIGRAKAKPEQHPV